MALERQRQKAAAYCDKTIPVRMAAFVIRGHPRGRTNTGRPGVEASGSKP